MDAGHQVAVSWNYGNWPTPGDDWQTWVVHLDAACNPMGSPRVLDPAQVKGINRPASIRMSDSGLSAFVYEAQTAGSDRLIIDAADGTNQSALSFATGLCDPGAEGRQIAMRRTTGDLAVICEGNQKKYYQRFQANGTKVDANPVEAPALAMTTGPWSNESLFAEYDDAGDLVMASTVSFLGPSYDWKLVFDPSGASPTTLAAPGDAPYPVNNRVLVASNGDFIVPIPNGTNTWSRYTPKGISFRRERLQT